MFRLHDLYDCDRKRQSLGLLSYLQPLVGLRLQRLVCPKQVLVLKSKETFFVSLGSRVLIFYRTNWISFPRNTIVRSQVLIIHYADSCRQLSDLQEYDHHICPSLGLQLQWF